MKDWIRASICMGAFAVSLMGLSVDCYSTEQKKEIVGSNYEFDEDSDYEISDTPQPNGDSCVGAIYISGNYKELGEVEGIEYFDVNSDNISIYFGTDSSLVNANESEWHIYSDNGKKVDNISLEEKISNGVLIVQTSLDGENWVTDIVKNDLFSDAVNKNEPIYSTKDIQLVNGCFYKIVVAAEEEKTEGTSKILFFDVDDKVYRKIASVYEFYAINTKEFAYSNPENVPRKVMGTKMAVKIDSGYSEKIKLENDDPHYGWDIGSFSVNGYTREMKGTDGNSIFLKNVGDKVTLWFSLSQDINKLNGNEQYVIGADKDGYDIQFEVPETNFKRGALIIRFTDSEGVKHTPIIYNDFLSANATTGADTRSVLFEEGDYEVALDYEIEDTSLFGSSTDYRICFSFSVRNGNTMFFPFDVATGKELRDNAITPNGFKIDMAKSKYLNIDVKREVLIEKEGSHSLDVRFNRPAKDGDTYFEEGVYTVDVTNIYTNEHTQKRFYVGDEPFLHAMSFYAKDVDYIDAMLNEGGILMEDGTIEYAVTPEPLPSPEISDEESEPHILEEVSEEKEPIEETPSEKPSATTVPTPTATKTDLVERESESVSIENGGSEDVIPIIPIIIVISIVIIAGLVIEVLWIRQKKRNRNQESGKNE